jgi:hypothetical protein
LPVSCTFKVLFSVTLILFIFEFDLFSSRGCHENKQGVPVYPRVELEGEPGESERKNERRKREGEMGVQKTGTER